MENYNKVFCISLILTCFGFGYSISNEAIQDAILYGYVIDPDAPNYLSKGNRIFKNDKGSDAVSIVHNSIMSGEYEFSNSEHTAAHDLAHSMKVKGEYGAFSAAASMEVSHSSSKSIKTVRTDRVIKALKYEVNAVGDFATFPQDFVTENFKRSVEKLSVKRIAEDVGVFFATKLDLGGEIRMSYTMQATEDDTQTSAKAEMEAAFKSGLMGGSGSSSTSYGHRESNKNAETRKSWSVQGGDTTVWLGQSFTDGDDSIARIQEEWKNTLTDENLYPANFELRPMWHLVKAVNQKKGEELQKYLEKKWGKQASSFDPKEFLPNVCLKEDTKLETDYKSESFSTIESCQRYCDSKRHCLGITIGNGRCYIVKNNQLKERNFGWKAMLRTCWDPSSVCIKQNMRLYGDIAVRWLKGYDQCKKWCDSVPKCAGITIGRIIKRCYLMAANHTTRDRYSGWVSAKKSCWKSYEANDNGKLVQE